LSGGQLSNFIYVANAGGMYFYKYGTNHLQNGTADDASYANCNIDIQSWNGIGIIGKAGNVFGDGTRTIVFQSRTGGILAKGSVTAASFFQSSDIRLKTIIKRDGDVVHFTWKDKRDTKIHIGYIAQEVIKENPDQVIEDNEKILSVNYIEILVEKIRNLEKEMEALKLKIK
jgi:preprotein translocase subunit SecG